LFVFDDGRGSALYVGGPFYRAGEIPDANGIARWDGREWSALGAGIRNFTDPPAAHNAAAMLTFDDGSGPSPYVGGNFTHAGGAPAATIDRRDGHGWAPVGEGLPGWGSIGIRALAVYDDGSGPALYAGGYFGVGVARWDGDSWSDVGGGRMVGPIDSMAVFDDGTGAALYAGGQMYTASGHPGDGLARWDGERWSPVGGGVDYDARSMHIFDDGTGPALYVGGAFSKAGGKEAWGIARWDGTEWHALDVGVSGSVDAMTTFDDGSGPALYVAGSFDFAGGPGGVPVENIARWRCASACPADCDGSGDLTFFDFLCFQNLFAAADPQADCDGSGRHDFFDFLCFQNAFVAGCG